MAKNEDDREDNDDDLPPRRRNSRRDDYDDDKPVYEQAHRGGLILALGLVGILACGVAGIFAWIMGSADLKAMERGEMDPEGKGLTQAGKILGMVATILLILSGFCLIAYFGFIGVLVATAK